MSKNAAISAAAGGPAEPEGSGLARIRDLFRSLIDQSRGLEAELQRERACLTRRIVDLEKGFADAAVLLASDTRDTAPGSPQTRRRLVELEQANREFAERCVQLEEHNTNLANLYAASYQLHSTLDPSAVVQCIVEIAVNLIGASRFALFLLDEEKGDFVLAVREGQAPADSSSRPEPEYPLEQAAIREKRTLFAVERQEGPICCTALHHEGKVIGYLSIYALLSHKPAFTPLDSELLDLLSAHAALAIVSSQSHVSVDRKLKTVQRFMELLKSP